jgi:tryptophan 7-halogenase
MNSTSRVLVAGGNAAAWIAAIGLARALKHRAVQVTLLDTGASGMPTGDWTLPSTRAMHKLLGISEPDFLRITGASFRLGTEHQGWQGEGSAFVHAHGSIGKELHGIPFYKLLMGRRMAGDELPTEAFSLAGAALRRGRFARPEGAGDSMTASFTYGYHLRYPAYVALLRDQAAAAGVRHIAGSLGECQRDAHGGLAAITLRDGQTLAADLFVDCTGPSAELLAPLPEGERLDWAHNLPCDRMLSGSAAETAERPATETRAMEAGWMWRAPLAENSIAGYVYQSSLLSDDQAHGQLSRATGASDIVSTPLRSGRRRNFWVGNVIALGDAAMQLEPLVGATLHFAQLGLGTLIELFPIAGATEMEAREYNRVMGEQADALRDFTLAHYLCATRLGVLWEQVRASRLPDRLAGRMDLFKAGGRILEFDHETFEELDWAWLYLGAGRLPESLEAQTALRVARVTSQEAGMIADQVRGLAESMPPHPAYLRHVRQARAR